MDVFIADYVILRRITAMRLNQKRPFKVEIYREDGTTVEVIAEFPTLQGAKGYARRCKKIKKWFRWQYEGEVQKVLEDVESG